MNTQEKKTILLVEDEAILALASAETIKEFGYDVITASSGEKALELIAEERRIDLILMDINLGKGINGPGAALQILKHRTLPIVFLTSHAEREMVEKVRGITRYGYVIKDSGDFVLQSSIEMAFELFEAHEKMRKSEEDFEDIFQTASDGIGHTTLTGEVLSINKSLENILDIPKEQIIGKNILQLAQGRVSAKSIARVVSLLSRVLRGNPVPAFELEYQNKLLELHATINKDTGRLTGVVRDVTEDRRKEGEHRRKELQQELLLSTLPMIFYTARATEDLTTTWMSHQVESMTGFQPDDFSRDSLFWTSRLHPDDRERAVREYASVFIAGSADCEYRWQCADGSYRWFRDHLTLVYDEYGTPAEGVGIWIDITKAKRAEKALKESESRSKAMFQAIPDLMFRMDREGVFLDYKADVSELYSQSGQTLVGKRNRDLTPPEFSDLLERQIRATLESRTLQTFEYQLPVPARGVRFYEARMVPSGSDEVTAIVRDITDRKQAEEALLENEAKYRNLVESMPDGFYRSTPDGRFLDVNPAMVKMLGYDSREELLHVDIPAALYPRPEDRKPGEIVNQNFVVEMESYQLRKKDGTVIWLEDHCRYLRDDSGEIQYHEGVCRDISERKTAEEKISALLAEKELLLQEVHHRIKNNMIIVMSLLTLQADSLKDSSAASALRVAADRLRSMMLLYDKLYRSQNFGEISMKGYLTSLVDRILENLPNSTTVDIVKEFDDFPLDVKILSPVGMIMNELLTNTMKYAFIGRNHGVITVSAKAGGNKVSVVVEDDGVGIPASVDMGSSTGLGLHLVEMLTMQLEGTMRIERGNGTKFVLKFEV